MKLSSKKGFTLVEVLVSAVIIVIVGVASLMSVTVLFKSNEIARNRSRALNLLQLSQEEVRRSAQTSFDDLLTSCQFPPSGGVDLCNFNDTTADFPIFSRTLSVTREQNSTELLRVFITVSWREMSQTKQLDSLMLLARPPEPLPGNIIGTVRPTNQTSTLIDNATITVNYINGTDVNATVSNGVLSAKGANFDFADPGSGQFILTAGAWQLTVDHDDYFPYTHPNPINIGSGVEVPVSIFLDPRPIDATIMGDVVDLNSGNRLPNFSRGSVRLHDDNAFVEWATNNSSYSFTIPFTDSQPQCFTVMTKDAFKVGYAYPVASQGGSACTYAYTREGYSTAIVQANSSLTCFNPYEGNAASDRVCVNPGETKVQDLRVVPVPEVLITGRVVDDNGNLVANATVRAWWPSSDSADWRKLGQLQTVQTDANGRFKEDFSVPAVQGMFSNSNPNSNFLRVRANGSVTILDCCNQTTTVNRNSNTKRVGPLFPGDPIRDIGDLVISTNRTCGNAQGTIFEDKFNNTLAATEVRVYNIPEQTNISGNYQYQCSGAGFRLRTGTSVFTASRSGYYFYSSNGTAQYASRARIRINANQTTTYNANLWPQGFGTVNGTLRDAGSGIPIGGAQVVLRRYTGSPLTATTNSSGFYSFSNVLETWPPPDLPQNNSNYNYSNRNHIVEVNYNPNIYLPFSQSFNLNSSQTKTIDINLTQQGNL